MGEITLTAETSMAVLNNPESGRDVRIIAACAMALFESSKPEPIHSESHIIIRELLDLIDATLADNEESGHA